MTKESPKLSKGTIKRMKKMDLNPEEMTEEQLRALESLEKPEKGHWVTKFFTYVGGFLEILALFSIFSGEWGTVFAYGIVGLILIYIGYVIQTRITEKKFLKE